MPMENVTYVLYDVITGKEVATKLTKQLRYRHVRDPAARPVHGF